MVKNKNTMLGHIKSNMFTGVIYKDHIAVRDNRGYMNKCIDNTKYYFIGCV